MSGLQRPRSLWLYDDRLSFPGHPLASKFHWLDDPICRLEQKPGVGTLIALICCVAILGLCCRLTLDTQQPKRAVWDVPSYRIRSITHMTIPNSPSRACSCFPNSSLLLITGVVVERLPRASEESTCPSSFPTQTDSTATLPPQTDQRRLPQSNSAARSPIPSLTVSLPR